MADHLIAAQAFPGPINMGNALDAIIVLPNVQYPIPSLAVNGTQIPRAVVEAMMAAQIAGFTALKVILYKNAIALGPNTAASDLVEPVGTWYARKTAVAGAVHDGSGTVLNYNCTSVEWDYSGVSPAELIQGWALFDVF